MFDCRHGCRFCIILSCKMSFLAKTSNIMDRDLYSSTFMTNYIEDDLNPARLAMINYFKWEKVATLFYNEDIFVSVSIFVKMIIKIIYICKKLIIFMILTYVQIHLFAVFLFLLPISLMKWVQKYNRKTNVFVFPIRHFQGTQSRTKA